MDAEFKYSLLKAAIVFSTSWSLNYDDFWILQCQKYLRRRKFRLHTAFLDASMISSVDAPVEFEVSIGNYGNKLDESLPSCICTTQPTNAVFDGSYYYFLPWGDNKPCVAIDCQWEDITFRLETLNLLLNIVDRLVGVFLFHFVNFFCVGFC